LDITKVLETFVKEVSPSVKECILVKHKQQNEPIIGSCHEDKLSSILKCFEILGQMSEVPMFPAAESVGHV